MPNPTPDPLAPLVEVWLRSAEPAAALEQLCREHPDLADDLRAHIDTIARPTVTLEVANEQAGRDTAAMPQEIGPYRLRDILGEGGMGTVYLAEQKHPVQRRVALKLIKLGMDSKAIIQRFQQERQALALMDHEGIAKVFDCGTSERGQPYFVMELVKGVPIDEFCEQQRLSLQDRLELIQQVCSAVQHAHQKGVVHRDLKPGNVLVTSDAGRYQVKIIDFGLAKAIGSKLIQESLVSELGVVIGTPEYMAPEQANPSNLDIDTRVDIYSIGVMLYEVLVGELPFSGDELRQAGPVEMQRILREVDPPKPSTQLTTMGPASSGIAHRRRVSVTALRRALKNDLDWVVVKALEKDRNRRYGSATALAEDLQRFLDHEPLQAGPPSAMYRLQKLLRRHRGTVTAAALVLVTLVGGGIGTLVQWRRAEKEKGSAEVALAERDVALAGEKQRVVELKEMIGAMDGVAGRLTRRSYEVQGEPMDRQALLAEAEPLARQAMEFSRRLLGGEHPATLTSISRLGSLLMAQDKLDIAEPLVREALETRRRVLGEENRYTLLSIMDLASLLESRGKLTEAEPLFREALETSRRVFGDEDVYIGSSIRRLAMHLSLQGRYDDLRTVYEGFLATTKLAADHKQVMMVERYLKRLRDASAGK